MQDEPETIYHIVSEAEYFQNVIGSMYVPDSIVRDGFIHCTSGKKTTLLVAKGCFSHIKGDLFILKIITAAVLAPVRFEQAAPPACTGERDAETETIFPHIYGSLNLDAVDGLGRIRIKGGVFYWPLEFNSLN